MTRYETFAVFNAAGGGNKTPSSKFVTWYDDLECDVAIVSEVFRFAHVLRDCGHLRVGTDSHGREDVGIVTKRKPRQTQEVRVTRFVAHPQPKPMLWHDRWMRRVRVGRLKRNRTVAWSSHAPAVIQDRATGRLSRSAGAEEWRHHGLPATEAHLKRDMDKNRAVVHGGDLNQHKSDDPEGPAAMYERLGMKYRSNAAMWFAWNPRRFALVSAEWIDTPPGSDGHKTGVFVLRRIDTKEK